MGKQLSRTKTDTQLVQETIINVLGRALSGQPISVGGIFNVALRAQEKIGWRSMFQGYWASEWQTAYIDKYATPAVENTADKLQRQTNMERWQAQLIKTVWTNMVNLWKVRNEEQHGRDKETRENACHEVLTNELKLLYDNREQYPDGVQNILQNTFADHCRDKASQIEDWLNTFCMTFQVMHIQPSL
jgi:hypothetical protein